MKGLIAGVVLSIASLAATAQQRYDEKYQRIITEDEKAIVEFFNNSVSKNQENIACYNYNDKSIVNVTFSRHRFSAKAKLSYEKLDSVRNNLSNISISHSHDVPANEFRKLYRWRPELKKQIKTIPDELINKRALKEFPSLDDLETYYNLKKEYGIDTQYILCSGNIYSFKLEPGISLDSVLTSYKKIDDYIYANYCFYYEKPGTCKEIDVKEISRMINETTPVKVLDHNSTLPIINDKFYRAD